MKACAIADCVGAVKARGYCNKHYELLMKYGSPQARVRAERGTGTSDDRGARIHRRDGRNRFEHVLIAERALGHPLPRGACVHHADGDPSNNHPSNLVICPDQAYHSLIHMRIRAMHACGNPSWRKCKICHRYDDPSQMRQYGSEIMHAVCNRERSRTRASKGLK